ncbi:sugar transferase [Francisellaceae bacterium]|nr:sugar transferase [Francisellaceae bacterium]
MIKRFFDISLSLFLLIMLLPIIFILYIVIYLKLGPPVIFKQGRPGYREKIFTIYKFRTMTSETDQNGNLLPDSIRLTKFGKFLRALSLDELPQLLNVLKGEMSFVGPRALLREYLPLYNQEQKKRHLVKPGITGWAQINGRNAISWEQKFKYDVWYVEHQSILLDMKIMWFTLVKVIKRSDINQDGQATMEKFKGSHE